MPRGRLSEKEPSAQRNPRRTSERPVFVVGCPRSGTTLLYHSILSSGNFAIFPFEFNAFNILGRKFPNLESLKERRGLIEFFVRTENFRVTGLEKAEIESRILSDCRNTGDFLRIVMEEMCRKQGARRWAEKTPAHLLHVRQIKRQIPDALIVHVIRDGRDAALSMANFDRLRQSYFWECGGSVLSMGVMWEWLVRKGRAAGQMIGRDYYELHFEDLVDRPRETLSRLGGFIGHDLDYDRIVKAGVGSVSQPESSFGNQASGGDFNPIGRWKRRFSPEHLARFEAVVGDCLEECGYLLSVPKGQRSAMQKLRTAAVSAVSVSQLELKHWLKSNTPLGRLAGGRAKPKTVRSLSEAV